MIPLFMDVRGKRAVVFGAGKVGLRKALFLAQEAEVTVVSREFDQGFKGKNISLVVAEIAGSMKDWISMADLVVAATNDNDLNDLVAKECSRKGVPCNRADGVSTFLIPSTVVRENYQVAISTLGKSPGMAKYLRMRIDEALPEEYDLMIALQERMREEAKHRIPDQISRERFLWDVLEDERVWEAIRSDPSRAMDMARERLVSWNGTDH